MVKANMVTLAMVDQKNKEQQNPKLNNVGSMWDKIGNAQENIDKGDEPEEDIQLLRGKKIDKKKKGTKKVVKKNGNNNKQRNRK